MPRFLPRLFTAAPLHPSSHLDRRGARRINFPVSTVVLEAELRFHAISRVILITLREPVPCFLYRYRKSFFILATTAGAVAVFIDRGMDAHTGNDKRPAKWPTIRGNIRTTRVAKPQNVPSHVHRTINANAKLTRTNKHTDGFYDNEEASLLRVPDDSGRITTTRADDNDGESTAERDVIHRTVGVPIVIISLFSLIKICVSRKHARS